MAEYIEREKAIELIERYGSDIAVREIRRMPAADVRPVVHGHWIRTANTWTHDLDEASKPIFYCSVCGRYEKIKEPFCNCGAKMDGKDGAENGIST